MITTHMWTVNRVISVQNLIKNWFQYTRIQLEFSSHVTYLLTFKPSKIRLQNRCHKMAPRKSNEKTNKTEISSYFKQCNRLYGKRSN